MLGYQLDRATPFYDVAGIRWTTADSPGGDFISRDASGASVDLGLAYDSRRNLVWAVLCKLQPGALQVLRIDGPSLNLTPLKQARVTLDFRGHTLR